MARDVRQQIPQPPPVYDQAYISQLTDAVNRYMLQAQAPAEVIAARFIMLDQITVPGVLPDTTTLPTGTMYLKQVPGAPAGTYFLTLVNQNDQ